MKKSTQAFIGFVLLISLFRPGMAQIEKKGQVGMRFLENPVSAEVVGRGGFGVTNLNTASAVFWNPAGLGLIPGKLDATIQFTKGIAEINQTTVAFGYRYQNYGVFGISVNLMDYGVFYGTQNAYNDQGYVETGEFSPGAYALALTYAKAVSDRFTFGVNLKSVHQDLGTAWLEQADSTFKEKGYSMTVPAFDVGAYYDFKSMGITFGAVIENVSKEVRYEEEMFPLPFAMKFGTSFNPTHLLNLDPEIHNLLLGIESKHSRDFREKLHFGAEYTYLKMLKIRTGYMANYYERGLTFGLGLLYKGFRFDYAYQDFGVFNSIHLLSAGFGI